MTTPIIGIYAGTFDPITNGHLDIIGRAADLVDTLYVLVADNPGKKPLFTLAERKAMVEDAIRLKVTRRRGTRITETYTGLTTDVAKKLNAKIMFRGMRPVGDYEHEYNIQAINRLMVPDLETVWLMADPKLQSISSSMVKELSRHGADVSAFVCPHIVEALMNKKMQITSPVIPQQKITVRTDTVIPKW